jgi:hypothetical protein
MKTKTGYLLVNTISNSLPSDCFLNHSLTTMSEETETSLVINAILIEQYGTISPEIIHAMIQNFLLIGGGNASLN